MAGRIRSIKPDFFFDEELARHPFHVRLAFEGLWNHADREGRLEDKPGYLKAVIFPYDKIDMEAVLTALATPKGLDKPAFILRYKGPDGKPLIQVINFLKHQRPHHTEAPSILPPPTTIGEVTVNTPLTNGDMPDGREGKGKEVEGKGMNKDLKMVAGKKAPAPHHNPISFNREDGNFQNINGQLLRWKEAYPLVDIEAEIRKAAAWMKTRPKRQKRDLGRFLVTWLSGEQEKAVNRKAFSGIVGDLADRKAPHA